MNIKGQRLTQVKQHKYQEQEQQDKCKTQVEYTKQKLLSGKGYHSEKQHQHGNQNQKNADGSAASYGCETLTYRRVNLRLNLKKIDTTGFLTDFGRIYLSSIIVIIFTSVHSVLFCVTPSPSQKRTLKMFIRNNPYQNGRAS